MKFIIGLILSIFFLIPTVAIAACDVACTKEGTTYTCSSANSECIQAAVTFANDQDTINVTATGTVTWGENAVVIPSTKGLKLIGPGSSSLTISLGADVVISVEAYAGSLETPGTRISGFYFQSPLDTKRGAILMSGQYFRIDHCTFESLESDTLTATVGMINAHGMNTTLTPIGVVDNNTFINSKVYVSGASTFAEFGAIWAEDVTLGDGLGVYIEDNYMYSNLSTRKEIADSQYASRYTFRYNRVENAWIMAHGLQFDGDYRGSKEWEVYGNSFTHPNDAQMSAIYSGTGVIFNNYNSGTNTGVITFGNYRSWYTYTGSGLCNGESSWDENEPGQSGWLCRDQIGSGYDASAWVDSSAAAPVQTKLPAYTWGNFQVSTLIVPTVSETDQTHVKEMRDYYTQRAAEFDGTKETVGTDSGVGCGTLAERPATCTTGVAYWATDQDNCDDLTGYVGDSTQRTSGTATKIEGSLYKCVANAWEETASYTPYTYPHPLRGESETTYTVTVTNTGNGHSASHTGERVVNAGNSLAYVATMLNGWKANITGCGCSVSNCTTATCTCTITPTENCEVTATSSEQQVIW